VFPKSIVGKDVQRWEEEVVVVEEKEVGGRKAKTATTAMKNAVVAAEVSQK
jgi:hypothetical protein